MSITLRIDKLEAEVVPEADYQPTRIIQHNKAIICFFADGSKTVSIPSGGSKADLIPPLDGDKFDLEKGVAMCIAKRVLGGYSGVKKAMEGVERIVDKKIQVVDWNWFRSRWHFSYHSKINPDNYYLTNDDGLALPWCAAHGGRLFWCATESEACTWLRLKGAAK